MPHVPVDMHINTTLIAQQFAHQGEARIHIAQVRQCATHVFATHRATPGVGIGKLLQHRWLAVDVGARECDFGAVVGFAVEWRVDVNQINLAAQTVEAGFWVARKK